MGEDGQRFALAVFPRDASEILLARRVISQEQDGGFGEGPLEIGMADFLACGSITFTSGFFGTFDEPTRGDERLHAGERWISWIS